MPAGLRVVLEQSGARMLSSLRRNGSEAQGEHELTVAGGKVDLSGKRNVAVLRARVFPLHLEMLRKILPSIGAADESNRGFLPRSRRGKRQCGAVVLGKKHRKAFVIADPSGIA